MAELCAKHNLALANDGKCVLCRRVGPPETSAGARAFRARSPGDDDYAPDATESIKQWVLGTCLALAASALIYFVVQERREVLQLKAESARAQLEATNAAPEPPTEPPSGALITPPPAPEMSITKLGTGVRDAGSERQDTPPPAVITTNTAPLLTPEQEAALSAAKARVVINMYSTDWCFICDHAREYLKANQIAHRDFDVEKNLAAQKRFLTINPLGSVPTFEIEGETLIGFNTSSLDDALRKAATRHLADVAVPLKTASAPLKRAGKRTK